MLPIENWTVLVRLARCSYFFAFNSSRLTSSSGWIMRELADEATTLPTDMPTVTRAPLGGGRGAWPSMTPPPAANNGVAGGAGVPGVDETGIVMKNRDTHDLYLHLDVPIEAGAVFCAAPPPPIIFIIIAIGFGAAAAGAAPPPP